MYKLFGGFWNLDLDDCEVPMCDMSVLMDLTAVLSPECQGVLMASVSGGSDNSALSCDECTCSVFFLTHAVR